MRLILCKRNLQSFKSVATRNVKLVYSTPLPHEITSPRLQTPGFLSMHCNVYLTHEIWKAYMTFRLPASLRSTEITKTHVRSLQGSVLKNNPCCTWGNQELFFYSSLRSWLGSPNQKYQWHDSPLLHKILCKCIHESNIELYRVKKKPFKCIKNNYFCWKQSRQSITYVVKKSRRNLHCKSTFVVAFSNQKNLEV